MTMVDIESIHKLFKARQINLPRPWLESCINWCVEEYLPHNYTTKDVQVKVFEQWLLADLRVLEVPSLPANLSEKTKYVLEGNYSLQIMYVVDISKSKYSQLQNINRASKNVDPEHEPSRRMLLLRITDGVQEIDAIEFELIPSLSLSLSPGIKIGISGPTLIRKGKMMLKQCNVKVIGGEVDELLIQNAAENILAKCLNLEVSNTPRDVQERVLDIVDSNNHQDIKNMNEDQKLRKNLNLTSEAILFNQRSDPQRLGNLFLDKNNTGRGNNASFELNTEAGIHNDDELNYLIELEEMEMRNINNETRLNENKSDYIPKITENLLICEKNKCEKIQYGPENTDIREEHNQLMEIWSIKKLNECIPTLTSQTLRIRGRFKSVVNKVVVLNNKFHLVVNIEDHSAEINVTLDSDIIANFLNCAPKLFMDFKDVHRRTSQVEAEVMEALKCLRDSLMRLDNVMEVDVLPEEKHPIVIKIL